MAIPAPLPTTLPRGTQCLRKEGQARYIAASQLVLGENRTDSVRLYYRGQWMRADYGGATHRNYVKHDGYNGMPPDSIDWDSVADAERRYQEISRRGQLHSRACELMDYGNASDMTYEQAWEKSASEGSDRVKTEKQT